MQPVADARGYDVTFLSAALDAQSAELASGCKVACAFVNDSLSAPVLEVLREQQVELIA